MKKTNYRQIDANRPLQVALIGYRPSVPQRWCEQRLPGSGLWFDLGPRWSVHGTRGSFTKLGLDTQEDALKAGHRPCQDDLQQWGLDPSPGEVLQMAVISGVASAVSVRQGAPNPPGNYLVFYANLRDYLRGQADLLIAPGQVRGVMQVLEAGAQSATGARLVQLALPAGPAG